MSENKSKGNIVVWVIIIAALGYYFGGFGNNGPEGVYYVGPSRDNSSFISFSPPNEYHSDYITWTGNKRNGLTNCNTKGSYSFNKETGTITVSGFYNSNCGSISSRNGTWKYNGSTITSPGGTVFSK